MSYSINSISFTTYNMKITSCIGALSFPKRLGDVDYDWGDDNGVEPYVSASDLHWDGREIQLMAFYNGSDLYTDLQTFRGLYAGVSSPMVTSYGSHTVYLSEIKVTHVFTVNQKALLAIKFWEPSVTVPSLPTATGGSGVKIDGYDLFMDFGLKTAGQENLYDYRYNQKELTYGDTARAFSDVLDGRDLTIELNGVYSSLASMATNINKLHAVLRQAGVRELYYNGITANVYFADKVNVSVVSQAMWANMKLKLRMGEVLSIEDMGQIIYHPEAGKIYFPGTGKIIYPK